MSGKTFGLLLVCTLLSDAVLSADFRTLDIGQPCIDVPELEKKLGTESIRWDPPKEIVAFKGKVFEMDAIILYFCPTGILFTGNYRFHDENFDAALKTYRKVYDQLISTYGPARIDPTPWPKNADPRWVITDPREYLTWWKDERLDITLSILETKDRPEDGWGIFVTVARSRK